MSQVSKYKLDNKIYSKIFSLFPQFLYRLTSKGKQNILIDTFFTNTEKIVVAKRIAIAFMLVKGYKYDQIVNKIKVSHGTVAKMAESLKTHDHIITEELENIAKEEAFSDFLNAIGYRISVILPPKGANWSRWRGDLERKKSEGDQPF